MTLAKDACLAAIAEHSAGFAAATRDNLAAPVEHCPGWSMADLVWHLTEVQWFWGTIVEQRLAAPPDGSLRPARRPDGQLVAAFEQGAARLVTALAAADPADPVWTWAPAQADVGFVLRHQVQEAAVHHWDAAHAAGGSLTVDPAVAADAVEEFLTFSVASDADPAEPGRPALDGALVLRATDAGAAWTVTDGAAAGTTRWDRGSDDGAPAVAGTAWDLLLWLYDRVALDTGTLPGGLLDRFRGLCFTD